MRLYLVTHKAGQECYCATPSLKSIGEIYPDSSKLELISDNVMIDSLERFDLLNEAYEFINSGANTQSNSVRVDLEERIKTQIVCINSVIHFIHQKENFPIWTKEL